MAEVRLTKGGNDSFVDALVKDPKKVPAVRTMVGFLGKAGEDKHLRLYSDANLTSWVEFEAADVLHTQALPQAESPLGGTVVWVRQDAVVKSPIAGSFLAGSITSGHFGGSSMPNPDGDPIPTPITPIANGLAVTPVVRARLDGNFAGGFLRGAIAQQHLAGADWGIRPGIVRTASWVDGCRSAMIECPATGGGFPGGITIRTSAIDACPSALVECAPGGTIGGGGIPNRASWVDGCRSALIECGGIATGGIRYSMDAGCRISMVAAGCQTAPGDPTIYFANRELAAWRAARGW